MEADFLRWAELRKSVSDLTKFEKELATPFTRWNGLFAALGASAPKEVSFTLLSLDQTVGGYNGTLRALSRGKDPAQVQERLGAFLAGIRGRAPMLGMSYAPVEIRPIRKEVGKGYEQEFLVSFTLVRED